MIEMESNGTNGTTSGIPSTADEVAHVYEAASEAADNGAAGETPTETNGAAPHEEAPLPAAAPSASPTDLRLRMKIWNDPQTGKRYLMPSAFMRDVVRGQPVTDVMYAYAMRDDDTKLVTLTAREWNALPFFFFKEDGSAPRATARPIDVVR